MPWLRLDDGFAGHLKLEGWTAAQKWAWLELMLWAAHHRTAGRVPDDLSLLPRSTTRALLNRAEASGLLDRRKGDLWIHDWDVYNPRDATGAERAARYRRRHGGNHGGSNAQDRDADRDATVTSRAGGRGTPPLPKRQEQDQGLLSSRTEAVVGDSTERPSDFKIPDDVLREVEP